MSTSTATTPDIKPVSILFVCLGNICRSTMAEGVFRSLTHYDTPSQHPLIAKIDSCGTGAYHTNSQPDPRTLSVLAEHGIKDYRHKARKLRAPKDFDEFDYVIGMDGMNMVDLEEADRREIAGKGEGIAGRVRLFGLFGGKSEDEEVGDPYYGGRDGFEVAYEQVVRCGKGLLEHIEERARSRGWKRED
ncbi:Low molecular weight phosphotyrosine protein phosphatase [Oleoguttula sp. CCFEE 5521]